MCGCLNSWKSYYLIKSKKCQNITMWRDFPGCHVYINTATQRYTVGLFSYLCRQCKGVVCTCTEAQWCWSEFRDTCVVQAIDTRLLSGFMTGKRSHAVPPNKSALTSLHLLKKKIREIIRLKNQLVLLMWSFLPECHVYLRSVPVCVYCFNV